MLGVKMPVAFWIDKENNIAFALPDTISWIITIVLAGVVIAMFLGIA